MRRFPVRPLPSQFSHLAVPPPPHVGHFVAATRRLLTPAMSPGIPLALSATS